MTIFGFFGGGFYNITKGQFIFKCTSPIPNITKALLSGFNFNRRHTAR